MYFDVVLQFKDLAERQSALEAAEARVRNDKESLDLALRDVEAASDALQKDKEAMQASQQQMSAALMEREQFVLKAEVRLDS